MSSVDANTAAIVVSVVVVLLLLMQCWDRTPPRRMYRSCGEGFAPRLDGSHVSTLSPNMVSDSGSGVVAREFDQLYKKAGSMDAIDYSQQVQMMGLDKAVFESHESFAHDIGIANRGASSLPVRSDDVHINPFAGLRRPDYRSVPFSAESQFEPSEYADQMPRATRTVV
jgi:hypothetical protein